MDGPVFGIANDVSSFDVDCRDIIVVPFAIDCVLHVVFVLKGLQASQTQKEETASRGESYQSRRHKSL